MSAFKLVSMLNPTVVLTAGPAISAGTSSQGVGTIVFSNSNGISFGMDGGVVTASAAGGGGGGADGGNTLAAGTQTAGASALVVFSNSNNVTFGMSGSSRITASASFAQSVQTQASGNIAGIGYTSTTQAGSTVGLTHNTAGISAAWPPFITTFAAQTTQTQPAGNIAGAGYTSTTQGGSTVGATHDSNGLSIAWPSFITTYVGQTTQTQPAGNIAGVGTTFGGTNVSGSMTLNTDGLNLALSVAPGGGGAADGYNILAAGTQTANTTGTVAFLNSNGLTWGMSNSSQITASYSQSTHSHSTAPGGIAAGTQTATSGTVVFADSNGVTWGMSGSSQVTASYSQSTHSHATFVGGVAAGTQTGTSGTVVFSNSNGISFGMSNSSVVTASHNGLTTARASNDAIGLNTAQSNVTWTVNSSGLSLDARGYAGTGTTFAGTNASASITQNSAGINLALSVAAGGGVTPVASASNGSFLFTTLGFSNANNVTFGTSAGGIITASVAAPGAAAENNWVNLLGANTAGNTTASGSTIGYSGINLTLSGTNGSVVNISAPATSSIVGASGISLSSNGSTMSVYMAPVCSFWPPQPLPLASSSMNSGTSGATGGSFQTTASLYVSPMQIWAPLTFGEVELVVSHGALSAGTGSGSILHAVGLYTLNGGTALSLVSSFEFNALVSVSSATAVSAHFYWGTNSTSNSTSIGGNVSASLTGVRQVKLYDSTGALTPGDYWIAHAYTARSSSVNVLTSFATGMFLSQSQTNLVLNYFGNNTTAPTQRHIGQVSTTQNNANSLVFQMPTSINTTAITNTGGTSQHRYNVPRLYV